jgi:hypothetical protein
VYHPFVTRVAPNMVMRRERMLPLRGDVLVTANSRVEPPDVVARAMLPSRLRLLNVSKALSVATDDLTQYLRVGVGDVVAVGDALAVKGGRSRLLRRAYRSPVAGTVVAVSNGRVLVQPSRDVLELEAHYRGTVVNVMSGLGAIIEVHGALIQGVWGSGKEGFGVLRMAVQDPMETLQPEAVDESCRGTALVAGSSIGEEVLHRAQETGVCGIIVGGLDIRLQELAASLSFPVIVTEGMGKLAISTPIFDLLQRCEGEEASMRATMIPRGGAVRPEIVLYVPHATGEVVAESRPQPVLREGSQVRVVGGPWLGTSGQVVSSVSGGERVESGGGLRGVQVRLESGEQIFVPQPNVEVLA